MIQNKKYLAGLSFLTAIIFVSAFVVFTANIKATIAQVETRAEKEHRAKLEAELSGIIKEIEARRVILRDKQRESVSLERDIAILNTEAEKARLSIRARDISIGRLEDNIDEKSVVIDSLSKQIQRQRESLAELLRKMNELSGFTIVEVVLGNEGLSEFFLDIDSFTALKYSLNESFYELRGIREEAAEEKKQLERKQLEEVELRQLQRLEKRRVEANEAERKELLRATKGQEKKYQEIITARERDAAAIRAELFTLQGSEAIPFERALIYANRVSEKTGVRPAFLLGIIAQESNFGENVGQCLLTNKPNKGDGKGVNTGRIFTKVMKPTRDVDPFLDIVGRLGINPWDQVVSCPMSFGFGGAMGPAQFIPSTWIMYEKEIARLTGHNPPSPWNPETAFMAAGILLKDNGAGRGGYAAERLAALRYFAGWRNAEKPAFAFYGDGVMALARRQQRKIDIIEGN